MTTTNYAWSLPIVGGNQNQWGTMLNNILTDIDAKMFARTGGTISGNVSVTGVTTLASTSGSGSTVIIGGSPTNDNVAKVQLVTSTTARNWQISSNNYIGSSLEFTPSTTGGGTTFTTPVMTLSSSGLAVNGIVSPEADNTRTLGTGALRWSTVYAGTGTINTSDAREKTKVRTLAEAEIEAAKDHSKEIGIYQFLESVKAKGDKARQHIGMTVQRSIEIMEKHGLDPMAYGFICYDAWDDEFFYHPKIQAVEAKDAVLDDEGNEVEPAIEAVEGKDAWTEQTQTAGDRYAFRYDQLNLFIARGIEARLAALEARA